jgi:hypothetical protein
VEKEGHLIYVKPIIKERWHGLHKMGRAKFQGTHDVYQAIYSQNKGGFDTGLNEEEANRLGKRLGHDLKNHTSNEYWQNFKLVLEDKTTVFNTTIPLEELQVKFMKASKFIANSVKELDQGLWPSARYVIHDEVEELEREATKIEVKARAVEVFSELSPEKKVDLLKVFGKGATNVSEKFAYTKLYEILEEDPNKFIKQATMKPAELKTRALFFDLEHKGIFRRKGTAVLYNDQQVGFDYDDAVYNLLNPKNQELLLKLKDDLEARG